MLGRHQEAVDAFGTVLAKCPRDTEALSGRAIALMAGGKIEAANADWNHQFGLLPEARATARACVALRLADYKKALPELDRAVAAEPSDDYWTLYRETARCRLGQPLAAITLPIEDKWPAPLLAVLSGSLPADKALSLQAEFAARELFLRRIGSVEEGAGVVLTTLGS